MSLLFVYQGFYFLKRSEAFFYITVGLARFLLYDVVAASYSLCRGKHLGKIYHSVPYRSVLTADLDTLLFKSEVAKVDPEKPSRRSRRKDLPQGSQDPSYL